MTLDPVIAFALVCGVSLVFVVGAVVLWGQLRLWIFRRHNRSEW